LKLSSIVLKVKNPVWANFSDKEMVRRQNVKPVKTEFLVKVYLQEL